MTQSFYSSAVAPRLVSALCGLGPITRQRRRIVPRAKGHVLEIGIGSGRNLPFYDPETVASVIGVDPDATMLKLGGKRFQQARVPLDVRAGVAENLPLENQSIDTALIAYTLCSLPAPSAALAEVKRVLKPGGQILFCEHGRSQNEGVARMQDRLNPVWRRLAAGCNLNRNVEEILTQNGFNIVELERFSLSGVPRTIGSHYFGCAQSQ